MNRPVTTLFMLMSLDGKISTSSLDDFDFDSDLPLLDGAKQGLHQYYEIEQTTDLWSFNTGRVQQKIGVNEKPFPDKSVVSFVLLDNSHLNEHGIRYFCSKSRKFVLITSNPKHPAFKLNEDNLHIIFQKKQNLSDALEILKEEYGCQRLTIQSGGTMNSLLLEDDLIDYVDIVVAPLLVGGKDTPTLIDGKSIKTKDELHNLKVLKLLEVKKLNDSYLRLHYEVIHKQV